MSKNNSRNEQADSGRTRGVRREQRANKHQLDTNSPEPSRPASSADWGEPKRTRRAICEGTGQLKSRDTIAGGILRQLIAKADSQLAKVEDELEQLEITRQTLERAREDAKHDREQLQVLLENLQQTIQENP